MRAQCILTMILASTGISCSESKQNQIKVACGNEDIREIRKVDNISKGCREALSSLLPAPEDNLKSKIIQFAHENGDFYLGALDSSGKARYQRPADAYGQGHGSRSFNGSSSRFL